MGKAVRKLTEHFQYLVSQSKERGEMTQSIDITHPALPRSTPEAQGISSDAILAFVEAAERDTPELHSLMLLRHGCVVAEGWWEPYGAQMPHMLFSLSKSFTATAAGLAAAEGLLSLDAKVLSFFPEDAPAHPDANLAAMTIKHLLSMATGHDQDTSGRLGGESGHWVRSFLSLPVEHPPGTHFVYNNGASYMISAILQAVTGQTLLEFLRPRLFTPLGIADPTWENSPQGINLGASGLSITTEDITRFGQLYLQKGVWQGQRLLPEAWVAEATAKQVENGTDPNSDWAQGYGYQFWRSRHESYRGDGAFGQFCFVLPAQDAVLAITSGVSDMGGVMNLVWEHLLTAMGPNTLPDDSAANERLTSKLRSLSLHAPLGEASSPLAHEVSEKTYVFPPTEDEQGMNSARWQFHDTGCSLTLQNRQGEHRLEIGSGEWIRGTTSLDRGKEQPVAAQGAWITPDTYEAKLCFTTTPFVMTITSQFSGDHVSYTQCRNVSFGPTQTEPQEGQAAKNRTL
jgi:CubicO group peptidase (beta-lactamase class C family)